MYFLIKMKLEACKFIKKETAEHLLSCKFSEIFKNTYFVEHLLAAAFGFKGIQIKRNIGLKWGDTLFQLIKLTSF